MKVILTAELDNLGLKGEMVTVKDGYARNYLIPKKFALPATKSNVAMFEEIQKQQKRKIEKERKHLLEISEKIKDLEIVTIVGVGEQGKLFGSVTTTEIADLIKEKSGIDIDKKKIFTGKAIKAIGTFDVRVRLTKDIEVNVKLKVEPKEEPAS